MSPQILHESVHDVIVERLKKAYAQVPIGDPLDGESHDFVCDQALITWHAADGVLYGPLHTERSVTMFEEAVQEAQKQGGTIVYGGKVRYN